MDGTFFGGSVDQILAVEQYLPGVRQVEPGDHAQDGGLAAAGRPQQGEELARLYRQGHIVNGDEIAEAACDVPEFQSSHDDPPGDCPYRYYCIGRASASGVSAFIASIADAEPRAQVDPAPRLMST